MIVLPLPKWPRRLLQALIATLGVAALCIDTSVFALYRFHINVVVLGLVFSGQVVTFPLAVWSMVTGGMIVLFTAELWLVIWLESTPRLMVLKLGRKYAVIVFLSLLATNAIHIWAAANNYRPVTTAKRYLPLFFPATANRFMSQHGWVDKAEIEKQKSMRMSAKSDLKYPLSP
ncbi:DUF3413 domain-containing protein [Vibrio sp. PP-XX7]